MYLPLLSSLSLPLPRLRLLYQLRVVSGAGDVYACTLYIYIYNVDVIASMLAYAVEGEFNVATV